MRQLIHIRRFAQVIILAILILSPISQIVRTYRQDPHPYTESPLVRNQTTKHFLDENDLEAKNKMATVYDDITGGPYTLDFYFLNFEEPYTAVVYTFRNLFISNFWNITQIVAIVLPLLFALFFGRIYCGYVCPWSLIVSWNLKIQKKLFNRIPTSTASIEKNHPKWKRIYFISLTGIVVLNPSIIQYILPPALLQHSFSDYILFGSYTLWGILLLLFISFELLQPAMVCRSLCPTGLFLTVFGKYKLFTLNFNKKNKCLKGCDLCNEVCWLGLQPKIKPVDSACDMCSRCIDSCPTNRLTITRKVDKKASKKIRKMAKASMIVLALFFISCSTEKAEYNYSDRITGMVLEENSIWQTNETDTLKILYAIEGNKITQRKGGIATINLHLFKNNETIECPIQITCTQGNSIILDKTMKEMNFPISIIKQSVYRVEFMMERNTNYHFTIKSLDDTFQSFEFDFKYPNRRF